MFSQAEAKEWCAVHTLRDFKVDFVVFIDHYLSPVVTKRKFYFSKHLRCSIQSMTVPSYPLVIRWLGVFVDLNQIQQGTDEQIGINHTYSDVLYV